MLPMKINVNSIVVYYNGFRWDILEMNFLRKEALISRYEETEIVSFSEVEFYVE